MAIQTRDQLINSIANNNSRILLEKASHLNTTTNAFFTSWRSTGYPVAGTTPTTPVVCTHETQGALPFTQQVSPSKSYLSHIEAVALGSTLSVELHDRLVHMAGLSGTVTTAQTVGIDMANHLATGNIAERIGNADYSEIQWWLEAVVTTGSTAVTATVNVTYTDDTTGNLTNISYPANLRDGRAILLNTLIPTPGKVIRAINTLTLSATTGTVGNIGFSATRYMANMFLPTFNFRYTFDWSALGLREIHNSACLTFVLLTPSSGTVNTGFRLNGKISHG